MTTETGATPKATWRLDGPNGSMAPRSAIEVLVDLNDKVTSGQVGEYQPVPLGFTPHGQDDRRRHARGRAAAHRRGPGHRQDDDGPPDGAQRRVRRPGERPLHLLRARRAVPAQPAHRGRVGARAPAAQDRRDQDPGRPQGDPRDVDGRGWRRRPAGRQPAAPPVARPDRPLRAEPVPAPGHADRIDHRRHARAHPPAQGPVGRPAAAGRRRLPAEGAGDPRAAQRVREGHLRRSTASRTSRSPRTSR